jgi:hypothetical protein
VEYRRGAARRRSRRLTGLGALTALPTLNAQAGTASWGRRGPHASRSRPRGLGDAGGGAPASALTPHVALIVRRSPVGDLSGSVFFTFSRSTIRRYDILVDLAILTFIPAF